MHSWWVVPSISIHARFQLQFLPFAHRVDCKNPSHIGGRCKAQHQYIYRVYYEAHLYESPTAQFDKPPNVAASAFEDEDSNLLLIYAFRQAVSRIQVVRL